MMEWSRKQAKVYMIAEHPAHTFALHGPVRSGKTLPAVFGFMRNACMNFAGYNFILASRSEKQLQAVVIEYMNWFAREHQMTVRTGKNHYILNSWLHGPPNKFWPLIGKDVSSQYTASGLTLAGALLDESHAMPGSFVDVCQERCASIPGSKFVAVANPEGPRHWYKENFIDQADGEEIVELGFEMSDNETLTTDQVQRLHKIYPSGPMRDRRIFGKWVAMTGMIYPQFEAAVCPPPAAEAIYRHSIAIDHAPKRVTHALRFDWYPSGIWCSSEWRRDGKEAGYMDDNGQSAAIYRNLVGDRHVADWYVDPAALEFANALGSLLGKHPIPADNTVKDGIEKTSQYLANGQVYISPECKHLIRELYNYQWDPKAAEQGEDKPIKQADHGCDAFRYFCYSTSLRVAQANQAPTMSRRRGR